MKITKIGLDIAKNVFQIHGVDEQGKMVDRKTLKRDQVTEFFAQLPPCVIGIEACGSAHYWARTLARFGHRCGGNGRPVRGAVSQEREERRQLRGKRFDAGHPGLCPSGAQRASKFAPGEFV